jgi:tetratricopeptide (TPR) repeat protein
MTPAVPESCSSDMRPAMSSRKRLWMQLLAVGCGLLSFLALELLCIAADWGQVDVGDDPFVGFSAIHPLFEKTPDGMTWRTVASRKRFFAEDSFDVKKSPVEFRIFVFGGSTVQGNPFSVPTSFPTYLQTALETLHPGKKWTVVNCGGVSYASYRLVPIMQECLNYDPNLYIFCGGHNEFLEDVSYGDIRDLPRPLLDSISLLERLRSYRVFRRMLNEVSGRNSRITAQQVPLPILTDDVDALLDHEGGFEVYVRDDNHAAAVTRHFQLNLHRMAELCRNARLPLLLIRPPSNLGDCPPFKSQFSDGLSADQRQAIQNLLIRSQEIAAKDLTAAIALAEEAVSLDPRFAAAWYELGQLQSAAGRFSDAQESFVRARDQDICPLRMTSDLEAVMRSTALKLSLPLIDAHVLLQSRCPDGIVGENVLVDHVHPSFRGHEDIAEAIAEWMISAGLAEESRSLWRPEFRQTCRRNLQSLDNLYFHRGQRHLENLQRWAAGRSGGPPIQKPL